MNSILLLTAAVLSYQVDVKIHTGSGFTSNSHQTFTTSLRSSLTKHSSSEKEVHAPDSGSITYLVFEDVDFPAERATDLKINSGGNDGWYIEKVEVLMARGWVSWGIEDMNCKRASKIDGDSKHPDYLEFTSRCHEIAVRVETGGKSLAGSVHDFEIELKGPNGDEVAPHSKISSPNQNDLDYIVVASPFPPEDLSAVKIDNGGIDAWYVEAVEVLLPHGWHRWGLPDQKCKLSSWVDYPLFSSDPKSLKFKECTSPAVSIISRLNIRVETAPVSSSGSIHDFPITAYSERASDFTKPIDVVAPATDSVEYITLESSFTPDDLSYVRIDHGGSDDWEIKHLEVEDEFGQWSMWGIKDMGCKKGAQISGDPLHSNYLEFYKCNEITILIDTENGVAADFEIDIISKTGAKLHTKSIVSSPVSGDEVIIHEVAAFSDEDVSEIQIFHNPSAPSSWDISRVKIYKSMSGSWLQLGEGSMCTESGSTSSTTLSFKDCLPPPTIDMGHTNVMITTDNTDSSPALYNVSGDNQINYVTTPVGKHSRLASLDSGAVEVITVGYNGSNGLEVTKVSVQDEFGIWNPWGKSPGCENTVTLSQSETVDFIKCDVIDILITTGSVGEGAVYSVEIKANNGSTVQPHPVITVGSEATMDHLEVASPFPVTELASITLTQVSGPVWEVAHVAVRDDAGIWDTWGDDTNSCSETTTAATSTFTLCVPPPPVGTYPIEVRVTTDSDLLAGSSGDFPLYLIGKDGSKSSVEHCHSPSSNEIFYKVVDAPFDVYHISYLRIEADGTNAWKVESVEIRNGDGEWEYWGLDDMKCRKGNWVDKDPNHPSYLEFIRCHSIEILINTGLLSGAWSLASYKINLISDTGATLPIIPTVSSPDVGQRHYIVGVAEFGASDIVKVEISQKDNILTNADQWHVATVQIKENGEWITWGIIPEGCILDHWIEFNKPITWERCVTPPPATESPCAVQEELYQIEVRITTGTSASAHSTHSFPITISGMGLSAPTMQIHEPSRGWVSYVVFENSPFPTQDAETLRIDAGGNNGWLVQQVEVKDERGVWRVWGLPDNYCKTSSYVDGDDNHPKYLEFARCAELDIRVTTGGKKNSGSIHDYKVQLFSKSGVKINPVPVIKSPAKYDVDWIRVVAPFPVYELEEVKIDNAGIDAWYVDKVEVQDEYGRWIRWGLPKQKCKGSSWVDKPFWWEDTPSSLSFKLCVTPTLVIVDQFKVRIKTGPGLLAGSVHEFPISGISDTAHDYTVPIDVKAPSAEGVEYATLDSTFPLAELTRIRIEHGGFDGWTIDSVQVQNEVGHWEQWGIKGQSCRKGNTVDSSGGHPFLEFERCNEIQVLISTGSTSVTDSSFAVQVFKKDGSKTKPEEIVKNPAAVGTELIHFVASFTTDDVEEIKVSHSSGTEDWGIHSVMLLDASGIWQVWGDASNGCVKESTVTQSTSITYTQCLPKKSSYQLNARLHSGEHSVPVDVIVTFFDNNMNKISKTITMPADDHWDYISVESPFRVEAVTSVTFEPLSELSITAVELETDKQTWTRLGLDSSCDWQSSKLAANQVVSFVRTCYEHYILIGTGEVKYASSSHDFAIDLTSKSGQKINPPPVVSDPNDGESAYLHVTAPFPQSELEFVTINAPGTDGWHVDNVQVFDSQTGMWSRWGIAPDNCLYSSFVDGDGGKSQLKYSKCTPDPSGSHDIELRVTTGDKLWSGSDHDFPIIVYGPNGLKSSVAHTHSPSGGEVFFRTVTASFTADQVEYARIDNGGGDGWYVESFEIQAVSGEWRKYGIKNKDCKASEWLDKDKDHPSYLEYDKCNDIEVLITTSLQSDAQSVGTFKIELISNSGSKFKPDLEISGPDVGQRDYFKAVGPFPVSDLKEVKVDHDSGFLSGLLSWDGWHIESVQVKEADGLWHTWGLADQGCITSSWIDEDSKNPKDLIFTDCFVAPPTKPPCTAVPDTLVPGFTYPPTVAPDTLVPTETPTGVPTAVPTNVPTNIPTSVPTNVPTNVPTLVPTSTPTATPTMGPGVPPTSVPTANPTMGPGVPPTAVPTMGPGVPPTAVPTMGPAVPPTAVPTMGPGVPPTAVPTMGPGVPPTAVPTMGPGVPPTAVPTMGPGVEPTPIPEETRGATWDHGDDDDDDWWIWLLVALGALLFCCCLFFLFFLWRKKKQQNEEENRHGKQFHEYGGLDESTLLASGVEEEMDDVETGMPAAAAAPVASPKKRNLKLKGKHSLKDLSPDSPTTSTDDAATPLVKEDADSEEFKV
eukprot:TRINITY_DN7383_c0_g1_i1.p1 TRINITY_DN7383_c0_g1~~TRINITY_DN7383_c0_g1_i1.p1  ORF type:complete len:2265 (+),score=528.93 TRINITY_DN7383_c0_g1_i1:24-6797(+)